MTHGSSNEQSFQLTTLSKSNITCGTCARSVRYKFSGIRDFTKVKKLIRLLMLELEKEVEDINGKEMCTDRTLWNIFYEMPAPY